MKIKNLNKKAVWSNLMQILLWVILAAVLTWVVYTVAKKIGFI